MSVLLNRKSKRPSQSKICYFQHHCLAVHQEIVRLKVPGSLKQFQRKDPFEKEDGDSREKENCHLCNTPCPWQKATPLHNWYIKLCIKNYLY